MISRYYGNNTPVLLTRPTSTLALSQQALSSRSSPQKNPFTRPHLIPPHPRSPQSSPRLLHRSHSRQHEGRQPSQSSSRSGRKCHSVVKGSHYPYDWEGRNKEGYVEGLRRREMEIQRKRVDLFGTDILRYKWDTPQQKNTDYFIENRELQLRASQNGGKIFKESTKIYQNEGKYREERGRRGKKEEKSRNRVKLREEGSEKKIKKMLSWNEQLLKQKQKQKNLTEQKKINSQNEMPSQPKSNRSPTFGAIVQTPAGPHGKNKLAKMASIHAGIAQQNEEDCVMEMSDGFVMQGSSPISSETELGGDLVKAGGGQGRANNLKYSSNFSDIYFMRSKEGSSGSSGSGSGSETGFLRSGTIRKNSQKMSYISEQQPRQKHPKDELTYNGQIFKLVKL